MSAGGSAGGAGAAAAAAGSIGGGGGASGVGGGGVGGGGDYQWAYTVMDSSRVSTCLISMLLIVYGSFRSLNMETEAREREQKKRLENGESMTNLLTGEPMSVEQS